MISLLKLELHRNLARRLTRMVLIIAIAGIAINGVVQFATHTKGDAASIEASRRAALTREVEQCMRNGGPDGGISFDPQGNPIPLPQPPIAQDPEERRQMCERFWEAQISQGGYGEDDRFHLEKLRGGLIGLTIPLVMLSLLLAASYIGAEWRANTVATQLVWEPRRLRVAGAKLLAAIITTVGIYVLLQGVAALSVLPAAFLRGTTDVPDGWLASYLGSALRGAGLVAAAATLGYSLASAGRNTTAAIGVAFGYLMIVEGGLVGSIFPGSRPWLIVGNSIVWMNGKTDSEIFGRSVVEAGLVLLLYAGLFATAALTLFRTRDVT